MKILIIGNVGSGKTTLGEKIQKITGFIFVQIDQLREECNLLNEYIAEGRYPGDLPWEIVGKQEAEEAIEAAEKIENFVRHRIKFEE